ncbi:MAG TPA: futalosine hydrolase [Arachidicoccus sp.]
MKIVITSATQLEVRPLKELVENHTVKNIHFHTCGVGILQSCFSIQKMIVEEKPDFIIQAGIAGAYDEHCSLGDVVIVNEEIAGSCGVEENGEWKDMFDLNLSEKNNFPFENMGLGNPFLTKYNLLHLPEVKALTVDEITTNKSRIAILKNKYNPFIESMEGASLHYCALQYNTAFIQIRGVSNIVGERDKKCWKMKDSVLNVCQKAFELIRLLNGCPGAAD